ncbi:MAG: carboxypeptidase-like regulatory domain-containing protein, partial [Flavobacteriales bacterium]
MQLRFLTLLIGLISCISISAQTGFISGTVVDKTNQPLPNATILLRSLNNSFSEATDIDGKFNIEVPANVSYSVEFSFINSTPIYRTSNLKQGQSTNWKIKLFEISTKLGIATVVDKQRPSMTKMDPKLIVKIPSINNDISSIILTQGLGTSITSELSSGYNVRGGNFDENLVYVNDIEVYRPFLVRAGQQEGLSFPNPDMISTMSFSAGGFEARYGDKLSSVLDISYNRPSEFSGSLMASLLGGALHFEDKSKKGNFTYNTGFRYKSNAYVLGSLDTEGDYNPNYIDLQTYMT